MASNSNSGQKFISRNRKPRVHITYEDPYDAEKLVELPFVMGVLADLSGNASDVAKPDMNDRKFLDIDMDNFDKRMAAIEPAVSMRVPNKLGAEEGAEKLWLLFAALTALLAIAVGFYLMKGVLAADPGTPKMIEIAMAIQEGALAYLRRPPEFEVHERGRIPPGFGRPAQDGSVEHRARVGTAAQAGRF